LEEAATPETPVATPDTPAATPDTSVATPDTPVTTPDMPIASPEAKPEPPEQRDPTYVTYGRAPEPVAPPPPEPEPEPEPPREPEPEPVAEAEPALDGETLPGIARTPEPIPVAEEPVPEPETEPEPRQPETPQPEPARAQRPARDVIVRRRAIAAGVVGVIAAAAIGFAVAPKSGGGGSTTAQTTSRPLSGSASNGPISVSIPAGWQRQSSSAAGAGLQLQNQVVVGPTSPAGGTLVIGTANTTDPSLLPNSLLTALPGGAPARQVVKLGGSQFYRYLALQPSGVDGPVSIYALPTTGAGTVLGACLLHAAAASFPADCERVLGSLKLSGASAVGLGPSSNLATQLSAAVGTLNQSVTSGQARLHSAGKPGQQATAANQLASAYTQAAAAIGKLDAPSTASGAVTALAAALAKTGRDYQALSRAAARNNKHDYTAASNAIGSDSGSVNAAFAQLAKLGYAS
jgi:hypothetical protein